MQLRSRASFLAFAASGVAVAGRPTRALAQASKVRMAGIFSDIFAEPFYGAEAGIWARNGFDADVSALVNGGAIVAAIAGGSLELGMSDLVVGLTAFAAGVPIDLIAGGALYRSTDNGSIIAVMKDSPFKQARDLAGKTFAVPTLRGQTWTAARLWLVSNGLNVDSMKIVELPQAAALAAMQHGTIDSTLLVEPFLTPARNDVRDLGHPYDQIAKEYMFSVWYANKAWVDADRDRAKRMVAAIYETARWTNTHRAETMAVLVREGKLDGDRLKGMARSTYATSLPPNLVQPVLDIAAQYKLVDRQVQATAFITRL